MKTSNLAVCVAIGLFLMAGCVTTVTGSVTEPARDDKDASELNYQLGARYYQQGSYDLARDRLLRATKIDPDMAVAHTTLALTYEELEIPRLAKESYENALRVAPQDFSVQNTYAVFLCRQGDYDGAQKYFDKSIAHPENDNSEVTMTNAGVCIQQKPDVDKAEEYFRMALDRKSNYGEALLQLCLLNYREKEYLSARAFLQRYMNVSTSTASVLYLASKIEEFLGNDRGKSEFEDQLIREFPTSSEAQRVLGSG